jgi:hypothetical protein
MNDLSSFINFELMNSILLISGFWGVKLRVDPIQSIYRSQKNFNVYDDVLDTLAWFTSHGEKNSIEKRCISFYNISFFQMQIYELGIACLSFKIYTFLMMYI